MHGCLQNLEVVGNVYAAHAGYNHWAEGSGIVILYPYALISENDPYNIKVSGTINSANVDYLVQILHDL